MNRRHHRGVTLIEVLMTIIIGSIAVLAMWPPFVAERLLWNKGKRQTEAQRDAQMAIRAMARVARECDFAGVTFAGSETTIRFRLGFSPPICFVADTGNGKLFMRPNCIDSGGIELIDGVRSRVMNFTGQEVIDDQLVRVHLDVSHRLRTTDTRSENEVLDTTLFLRNG